MLFAVTGLIHTVRTRSAQVFRVFTPAAHADPSSAFGNDLSAIEKKM